MKLLNSFSLYMSNLFSSPAAFDFSQGLVFYHIKAAGCVCFSGARGGGGGGGRAAGRGCQPRRAAGGKGERRGAQGRRSLGQGFVLNPGLAKLALVQPLLLTQRHPSLGLAPDGCGSNQAEKNKLHLLQVHWNNFKTPTSPPPHPSPRSEPEGCGRVG